MANNPNNKANLKPFKKGESGNPAGRPPKLPDLDELMAKVLGEEKNGKTAAETLLIALFAKAAKGDTRAAEILMNRGYGLPKQKLIHVGDPNEPIVFKADERYLTNDGG